MDNRTKKNLFLPFSLSALIILIDQLTKAFIVKNWPTQGSFIADIFENDFLIICHVRNKAIAFSLGDNIPNQLRFPLFVLVPLVVIGLLVWYYLVTKEFSRVQRWALAGIIGGGMGNIVDRIFRRDGVVDFISVKFYGLFGMERWPTFNVADASVVICSLLLLVTMLIPQKKSAAISS